MIKFNTYRQYFLYSCFIAIVAVNYYFSQKENIAVTEDDCTDEVFDSIPVLVEYGIVADSFNIHKGKIAPKQFLSDILLKYGIPYPEIMKIREKTKGITNIRDMRAGHNYCILTTKDSIEKARYFIYEENSIDFVVFDLRNEYLVYRSQKESEITESVAEGVINSSLYQTIEENGLNPSLAANMADIFAWTIDFYRIQKGDRFKVLYDELFVEGKSIGVKKIKGVCFTHANTDYWAFYFEQDGIGDYFDQEAKGLKKAFLKSPLKFSRISSRYTMKRFHPVQQRWKAHLGTDYAAPTGTPIMAVGDGTVLEATHKAFNGNYVKIKHNNTYTTQYLHMSKIASGMKAGKHVRQGDVIGYVGSTGLATGPHVCFRFWKNGKQVDHLREKFPSSEPVKKQYLAEYKAAIEPIKLRLAEKQALLADN
jgi:murein DD-endopeptidase MepM/ murein hydrolase activator NlpD